MVDTSVERPAKIPRVPTKMRSARRSAGAPAIVTELCAVTGEEPPTLSSAGASNASTLCETPGGALPAPEDAPPAGDTAVGSAQKAPPRSGTATHATSETTRQGRKPPHLNLRIDIPSTRPPHSSTTVAPDFQPHPAPLPPTSLPRPPDGRFNNASASFCLARPLTASLPFPFPSSQLRKAHERPKFAPELERLPGHGRADPPVTPATALSVLPCTPPSPLVTLTGRRWLASTRPF